MTTPDPETEWLDANDAAADQRRLDLTRRLVLGIGGLLFLVSVIAGLHAAREMANEAAAIRALASGSGAVGGKGEAQ